MRIKIYQIDSKKDAERVHFEDSFELERRFGEFKVDPTIYKQVFNDVIDESDVEDIFRRFNTDSHPLYRGSPMSVSDIVVTEDGQAHYCDAIGFREVDFDESKAEVPDNLFRIVYVEPHRPAYETYVEDSYEGETGAVKGMIELIYNGDGTILVGNEEAKIIGM